MATEQAGIKRGRGRPRREGADAEITTAALELLRDRGYAELTVDAVAERVGVAKTTVYRRWPSKGMLVATTIAPLCAPPPGDDVTETLRHLIILLNGEHGVTIASLIADGEAAPVIDPWLQRLRDVADGGDAAFRADLLTGAIWTRLLVTREPLTDDLAERIVAAVR